MSIAAILALAAGTYLLKAAGPVLLGGRRLPPRVAEPVALLAPALLMALVVTQTLGGQGGLVVDARLGGVAAAIVAVGLRAPFLVVLLTGTATAALLRLAGIG